MTVDTPPLPSTSEPKPIRRLGEQIINKIAAGEVSTFWWLLNLI